MRALLLYLAVTIFIFSSCSNNKSYKDRSDISNISIEDISIKRYEQDLFTVDQGKLKEELNRIAPKYPIFLFENPDTLQIIQMANYLNDPLLIELYQVSSLKYKDLGWLESDLTNAYKHIKYYFPEAQEKDFYTYISGIDFTQPIYLDKENVIIALDMYLGKDLNAYKQVGIPQYKARELDKEYIISDILYNEAYLKLPKEFMPKTVLDFMLHEAKAVLFADLMMPAVHDSVKIKYTGSQLNWCIENESNIWAFLIENQLIYNSDKEQVKKLILESPYTAGFSEESPGKMGVWVGWNILRSYLERNPDTNLKDLLENTNSQEILENSGYRPKY